MAERGQPVLAGVDLARRYPRRGGILGRPGADTAALAGVSLALHSGELLGLVGRSGAGKSTLLRLLAGLESPDSGTVLFGGRSLGRLTRGERRAFRRAVQVVFQDPATSLDPRQRIGSAIGEPLAIHRIVPREQRFVQVSRLLDAVGLPSDRAFAARLPHELSGGERQRVAIARALACVPRVVLLDEPVASLDVSVRGQVLNLLLELRGAFGLTMLLVAHDVALVHGVCDRAAVMLAGRIVEEGPAAAVLERPQHPYTRLLVEASGMLSGLAPSMDESASGRIGRDVPACSFLAACARRGAACQQAPELRSSRPASERRVACHNPEWS